jgi:hypothetical protein
MRTREWNIVIRDKNDSLAIEPRNAGQVGKAAELGVTSLRRVSLSTCPLPQLVKHLHVSGNRFTIEDSKISHILNMTHLTFKYYSLKNTTGS